MNANLVKSTLIAGIAWTIGLSAGHGRDVLELESRYNGDGWFEYRLRTLEDPFFKAIRFGQLLPDPFTNYVANTLPDHWTNFVYNGVWAGIKFDATVPQPRINEISFSVKSGSTHFRRATPGFVTSIFLEFVDLYKGGGLGGYVNLNCLVPCSPEEADGSPPTIVSRIELIPDVKIDQLIFTNGQVHGLTYSWIQPSTVELQASHNLADWMTVARFFGNPPQTTWTTNISFSSFGQFFQLSLIANSHLANTQAPVTLASTSPHSLEIPIGNQEYINNEFRIGFISTPNGVYEVDYCELPGKTITTKQITASKLFTTLVFDIPEPRSAAFFKVRQLVE
ncbi:MAG: hypothetical protein HOP33_03445 [Verrucomicrobia bacterium]|nr:hypothetical protein [Verrucomicrobiota bacterium]